MLDAIRQLILGKDICVLATCAENQPHCSLMAYVAAPDARRLYMLSSRSTKKYSNVLRNTSVSLLIDSRGEGLREQTRALTVTGACAPMADGPAKDEVRRRLLEAHPHLAKLAAHPDADILEVEAQAVLLLDGATDAYFERLT